jgi:hypothetical protein
VATAPGLVGVAPIEPDTEGLLLMNGNAAASLDMMFDLCKDLDAEPEAMPLAMLLGMEDDLMGIVRAGVAPGLAMFILFVGRLLFLKGLL